MSEQRFIAISEEEYNSFKHGEYERKIKSLQEKIDQLEKGKIDIAKAKAVRIETTTDDWPSGKCTTIQVISNEKFEDDILESIRNTEFSHVFKTSLFDSKEYVKIGDTCYYKNKWCEELKNELQRLSCQITELQKEKKELEDDVRMLNNVAKNTDKKDMIELIIDTLSKNDE